MAERAGERLGNAWTRCGVVAAVVVILDQLTKQLVKSSIALGSERHVIPGVLLVHTTNSGVAFSLFAGSTIEVIATAIIVLALVFTFYGRYRAQPWLWLACGMVVGGALGNLIDRLRYGAVTDFIKLPDWPAFNVADSAITLGVVALVLIVSRGEATRKA